jgi:hypothetical protein
MLAAGSIQHAAAQGGIPGTPGGGGARLSLGGGGGSRGPSYRTIIGKVTDTSGKPVVTAMVYLKNIRTSATQVLLTGDAGTFRFSPFSLSEDYQVWAEANGHKTQVRTVSQYNQTPLVDLPLQLGAEAATPPAAVTTPKPN